MTTRTIQSRSRPATSPTRVCHHMARPSPRLAQSRTVPPAPARAPPLAAAPSCGPDVGLRSSSRAAAPAAPGGEGGTTIRSTQPACTGILAQDGADHRSPGAIPVPAVEAGQLAGARLWIKLYGARDWAV